MLELRAVRTSSLGRETPAYQGKLYVDGKFAALVGNDGNGGSAHFYQRDNDLIDEARRQAEAMPAYDDGKYAPLTMDLELWLNLEVGKIEFQRTIMRKAKKKTLYQVAGQRDGYYEVNVPFSAAAKRDVLAQHPDAIFLNETVAGVKLGVPTL